MTDIEQSAFSVSARKIVAEMKKLYAWSVRKDKCGKSYYIFYKTAKSELEFMYAAKSKCWKVCNRVYYQYRSE